jgi:hypothetical protein
VGLDPPVFLGGQNQNPVLDRRAETRPASGLPGTVMFYSSDGMTGACASVIAEIPVELHSREGVETGRSLGHQNALRGACLSHFGVGGGNSDFWTVPG